jgi:hypothetical protein
MRIRQRLLPCGRVISFEETTPHDIGKSKTMKALLLASRKKLDPLYSYDSSGRTKDRWVGQVYNRFATTLTKCLVERLLAGDRIETINGHKWMIGFPTDGGKFVNWHTDGKSFRVGIQGLKGKFGIRLSRAKRRELKERILGGQNYHS